MSKIIQVKGCWGKDFKCPYASGWDPMDLDVELFAKGYEYLFCAYNRKTWPNGKGHGKGKMKKYDDIVRDKRVGFFSRMNVHKGEEIINIPGWCPLEDE